MDELTLSGVAELELDDFTRRQTEQLIRRQAYALCRHEQCSIAVHCKTHPDGRQDKKHKYSVHVRLFADGTVLYATSWGWNLHRTIHDAFECLELQFRRHKEVQAPKRLGGGTHEALLQRI